MRNTARVVIGVITLAVGAAHATFVVPKGTTSFACDYHSGMRGTIMGA